MVTGLSPPKAAPPEPLPMHPMSEDNYGTDEGTALLVLETIPPTLIIAHSRGNSTLYHCVYMEGDKVCSYWRSICICTTGRRVPIREVSSFQRVLCTGFGT